MVVIVCYDLSQMGFESIVPVVRDEAIDGNAIADCSDGEDFARLLSPSCFKALKACLERAVPASQRRVRAGESVLDTVVSASCSLVMIRSCLLGQSLSLSVQSPMQPSARPHPRPKSRLSSFLSARIRLSPSVHAGILGSCMRSRVGVTLLLACCTSSGRNALHA